MFVELLNFTFLYRSMFIYMMCVLTGGVVWPNRPLAGSSAYSPRWQPPYSPPVSYQIEATSYLLLTYAFHEEVTPAFRHLKWLVSKQNQLGGYSSTQVFRC